MDDLFGQIEYRSKSDVIVMRLLRMAMDKAHENVQSMNGPMEFLHERSKFYELATILVEGGLNIVQEEAAGIQETSREKIISDLMEIKNWLQKRNEEMRHLIMDKDKELLERIENELKLKETLESNETELEYLREKEEEIQRSKINGGGGGGIDDICSLKNSVDQQVWNIKQKLEYEERNAKNNSNNNKLVSNVSDTELYAKLGSSFSIEDDHHFSSRTQPFFCRTLNHEKYNRMIRQMSSDIDILKGTFDIGFGRMQKNAEFNEINHCCYKKKWTGLVRDITALVEELKSLSSRRNKNGGDDSSSSLKVRRTVSEPLPELLLLQTLEEESKKATGIQSVAKMIKSHETFIEKHRKASTFITKEMPGRKKSLSAKRDKEFDDELESKLKRVIKKFDKIIESNKKNQKVEIHECDTNHVSSEMLLQSIRNDISSVYMQELVREWKRYAECRAEEHVLEEEIYKFVVNESVKCVLNTGNLLMKQVENECSESAAESLIREDVQIAYFREMSKEWKTEKDDLNIEMNIRKDVYQFLMTEMAKKSNAIVTTPTSEPETLDQKSEIHRYESSIGDLDSVLDSAENEQNIKKWLLTAGEKLETVLHEVHTSKALLSMLDTENTMNNPQTYHEQDDDSCTKLNDIVAVTAAASDEHEEDEMLQLYHSILTPLMGFQQILVDFEHTTCTNLESKSLRIEGLKQEVSKLVQSVTSIKKRKFLYKKAFIIRCKNLLLAENEVDLLGNQVDKLVCLLQKVYFILNQNSAVLAPYFQVLDMLNLIKRELAKEAA